MSGKTISVEVEPTESIESVKQKIADQEGVEESTQRLIFGGKQLENGKTLQDYDLGEDAVVHLVLRLRGGASIIGNRVVYWLFQLQKGGLLCTPFRGPEHTEEELFLLDRERVSRDRAFLVLALSALFFLTEVSVHNGLLASRLEVMH